jgi:hypothetical protein
MLTIAVVLTAVMGAEAPRLAVPWVAGPVRVDGRVGAGEWAAAAVVRRLTAIGSAEPARPGTAFLLAHDGTALYVAAVCEEPDPGYPRASARLPTDYLGDDDAVQVVLGTADANAPSRDVIAFGGYPGAMGTPAAAADHYYQFTVNAAGARARTYNEGALEGPLFEAAVKRERGRWTAEMRIPFASAGIADPQARLIFTNLIRFRPPDMLGWYLPAFGGYAPMPFGTAVFLARGQEGERTVEAGAEAAPSPATALKPTAPRATGAITWYPLGRCATADVEATGPVAGCRATLDVPGAGRATSALQAGRNRLIVDVPASAALPAEARLVVTDARGGTLLAVTKRLEAVAPPEWLGTKVGAEYLRGRIPRPWTRPVVAGATVRLYGKAITFAPSGLFGSVRDDLGDLLAGPGEVVLALRGRRVALRAAGLTVEAQATSAVVRAAQAFPGGAVETRAIVDYDGFTVVKLRVRCADPRAISHLAVRFPLRRENARFVHRQLVQQVRELTGHGWRGDAGPVWLGGQDKGLAFSFDTTPFLSADRRSQVETIEEPSRTWLQANLVDGPGEVSEDGRIFRFFLQPTPTKRASLRKAGLCHNALWFEEWSDWQGYPDLAKMPEVRRRAVEAHAAGRLQLVYFDQLLAETAPGFREYRDDLIVPPGAMWYRRAYGPSKDVPCWLCCPRGPYGDLLLDGIARLVRDADLDGVYMDGTTVPWECDNPSHRGCGRPAPVTWDGDDLTPITATRAFLKRLRGVFDARGKAFYLVAHTGGAIDISCLSLVDGYYEGEQLARYRPGYRLPLAAFAVGYSGRPWGFRIDLIPSIYAAGGSAWPMMTWALLHDGEVAAEECTAAQDAVYRDFSDDAATRYFPYWRPQPHLRRLAGDVHVSYYLKADAAMVVASNLTWDDQRAVLDVSRLWPGGPAAATDAITGRALPLAAGRLVLEIPRHRFAAVRLTRSAEGLAPAAATPVGTGAAGPAAEDGQALALPLPPEETVTAPWQPNEAAAGVGVQRGWDLGDGARGLRLTSTVYAAEARARLALAIGRDATVAFRLRRGSILRLEIGPAGLMYYGGWKLFGVDPWSEGCVYQPGDSGDAAPLFVLSLRGGVLDAVCGGRLLARGVVLDGLGERNAFALATWGGEAFAVGEARVCARPMALFAPEVQHPVR